MSGSIKDKMWNKAAGFYSMNPSSQSYTSEETILAEKDGLRSFLVRLGSEGKQAAVGFVIDRDYMEIQFDADGNPQP